GRPNASDASLIPLRTRAHDHKPKSTTRGPPVAGARSDVASRSLDRRRDPRAFDGYLGRGAPAPLLAQAPATLARVRDLCADVRRSLPGIALAARAMLP